MSVLVANAFVSSQLDYYNSLFRSLSKFNLRKSQFIQICAARIVSDMCRYTSITPGIKKLHWLLVEHYSLLRITLVFKFLHTGFHKYFAPYLSSDSSAYSTSTVKVAEIYLLFKSSILLLISLSNSLVIVLLSMLPLFVVLCPMRFVGSLPCLFQKAA